MPALLHIPEVWPGPPHRVSTEFLIGQLSTHSGRKSYRSQRRSRSRPGPPRHRSLPRLPSSRSGPEPPRRSSRPAEPLIRSAPSPPVRVSFPLPPEIESALDPPRTVSEPASPRRVCRSTLPPNESRPLPPLTVPSQCSWGCTCLSCGRVARANPRLRNGSREWSRDRVVRRAPLLPATGRGL